MSIETTKQIVTTTLGKLWAEAKARGIEMSRDGTYMMQLKDGSLWIEPIDMKVHAEQKTTCLTIEELCKLAKASGVKTRKDDKGHEYFTLNIDEGLKKAWIETPTDKDVKIAKAITPNRGK